MDEQKDLQGGAFENPVYDEDLENTTDLVSKLGLTDGRVLCDTFAGDGCKFADANIGMQNPLPMWKYLNALEKVTIPREKFLTQEELEELTDEELVDYHRALSYWKNLWFVMKFRSFHQQVRAAQVPGPRKDQTFWRAPPLCIPVRANVLNFDWKPFLRSLKKWNNGNKFDVIVTDPPWTLATEKSTRGVALNYDQITDVKLMNAVPFYDLLSDKGGAIFMWVINAKLKWSLEFLREKGFKVIDLMTWLKMSQNRLLARGHGYYLQHAKEDCIIAVKGDASHLCWDKIVTTFIAEKRCQSQKPAQFYDMMEALAPNGTYCEVFARRNNLRNGWVSIGNQL